MIRSVVVSLALLVCAAPVLAGSGPVRLKDLGRFQGWRVNPLVGYGIVTGLSGSGDSPRSEVTRQAIRNALSRLGANITTDQVQSRNVAAVIVTATLPPSASIGDRIDVTVTSIGDARSLAGGTLLMTPLIGPDQQSYALAQGALIVGGYRFEADQNLRQKNYPTSALVAGGASVEKAVDARMTSERGDLAFVLAEPGFSAAENVANAINRDLGTPRASAKSGASVSISADGFPGGVNALIARVENIMVTPDPIARIVVNERSGTVVAGGGVQISDVVVAQGDIKVSVSIDNRASQPAIYGGYVGDARGVIVTNTRLDAVENRDAVMHFPGSSVADLMIGLSRAKVSTRDMIAVLQAMKAAGALHAEILVQ